MNIVKFFTIPDNSYHNIHGYYSITSACAYDTDEIYSKLVKLLSMEENKIYENDNIRDTIETYKLYKDALE